VDGVSFPTPIYIAMRYKVGYAFKEQPLADSANAADTTTFKFGRCPTDIVQFTDPLTHAIGKSLADAVQFGDSIFLLFAGGVSLTSTATVGESGQLRIQDYCDFTYFEADYVGISSTF